MHIKHLLLAIMLIPVGCLTGAEATSRRQSNFRLRRYGNGRCRGLLCSDACRRLGQAQQLSGG